MQKKKKLQGKLFCRYVSHLEALPQKILFKAKLLVYKSNRAADYISRIKFHAYFKTAFHANTRPHLGTHYSIVA